MPEFEDATEGLERARAGALSAPRYTHRLTDKFLLAFHHACDQGNCEIAMQLLGLFEVALIHEKMRLGDDDRRQAASGLVEAHERLWLMMHYAENR